MGQKVNPYGIRLGINKTWSSRWFSKSEYTKLIKPFRKKFEKAYKETDKSKRSKLLLDIRNEILKILLCGI